MLWLKRDRWKAGIALAGMLLLLGFMVWVPLSAADAQERVSGLATPVTGTVQATPTVDPTMIALQKEQLTLQNDKLNSDNSWAWLSPVSTIFGPLATIGTILVGILVARNNFRQWSKNRDDEQKKRAEDQRIEREKRDEERFQKVVEGLGSQRTEAKVGAAIMLRTFLQPGYERFYGQAFDLAVAHLRLRKAEVSVSNQSSSPTSEESSQQERQAPARTVPIPLDSLSQALTTVFKESFPLARNELKKTNAQFNPQLLDATNVRLDNAYLDADLAEAWLVRASLREADLSFARLQGACLIEAQLEKANLSFARLQGASLDRAQLQGADLSFARLQGAHLNHARLQGAKLKMAELQGADLSFAQLHDADLWQAKLSGAKLNLAQLQGAHLIAAQLENADLSLAQLQNAKLSYVHLNHAQLQGADLDHAQFQGTDLSFAQLQGANPEDADSLKDTKMNGVTGLTPEQRERCIKKGAIFDDVQQAPASATSSSSSLLPYASNDAQAPSTPPAQESFPPPDTGDNSAASSQPGQES